jgi:hypothetical protein
MKTSVTVVLSEFAALSIALLLFSSCDSPDKVGATFENQVVALKGVNLSGKADEVVNRLFIDKGYDGLTNGEFLSVFGPNPVPRHPAGEISVIVDMSAGMNIGIDRSYAAMNALITSLDPASPRISYYHADDSDVLEPLEIIKSISDAVKLQNPSNFVRQYSKLKPALDHATSNSGRITVLVTDFLLDEGNAVTARRFKDGTYRSGETADNTTWAKDYFTRWFADGHAVLIYPYRYSAINYYRKNETKYIYYLVFVPLTVVDSNLDKLLSNFSRIFEDKITLEPKKVHSVLNVNEMTSCNDNYKALRNPANLSHGTHLPNVANITFSHLALQSAVAPVLAACQIKIHNESPFTFAISSRTVDPSPFYYDVLRKEKDLLRIPADPFKTLKEIDHVRLVMEQDNASLFLSDEVVKLNYLSKYQGLDRLLATGIYAKGLTLENLPDELSWDFQSKFGTLQNNALSESIRLALEQYTIANPELHLGTVFFSIHHN